MPKWKDGINLVQKLSDDISVLTDYTYNDIKATNQQIGKLLTINRQKYGVCGCFKDNQLRSLFCISSFLLAVEHMVRPWSY
jgi:hypothetical protein